MPTSKASALAKKKAARDVSTFRASHDPSIIIPGKLTKALADMARQDGPESYAYENADATGAPTMVQRAGISAAHISQHRRQFAPHVVKVKQDTGSRRGPRFVWFATVAAATKARGGPVNLADFE